MEDALVLIDRGANHFIQIKSAATSPFSNEERDLGLAAGYAMRARLPEAGLTRCPNRSSFREIELGDRFNRITTTDVLQLNYQQPVGGAPNILQRGQDLEIQ